MFSNAVAATLSLIVTAAQVHAAPTLGVATAWGRKSCRSANCRVTALHSTGRPRTSLCVPLIKAVSGERRPEWLH